MARVNWMAVSAAIMALTTMVGSMLGASTDAIIAVGLAAVTFAILSLKAE